MNRLAHISVSRTKIFLFQNFLIFPTIKLPSKEENSFLIQINLNGKSKPSSKAIIILVRNFSFQQKPFLLRIEKQTLVKTFIAFTRSLLLDEYFVRMTLTCGAPVDAAITNGDEIGTANIRGANGLRLVGEFSCLSCFTLPLLLPFVRGRFV